MSAMKSISTGWLQRQAAKALVLLLAAPLAQASSQTAQDQSVQTQQQTAAANGTAQPALPNAPQARRQQKDDGAQPTNSQTAPTQQQTTAPVPVGTAAAPAETPVGTAVSRPAGAAIAPAKQKRRRTFLIRTALVVGAAVAIGTVVALSKASRSRP